MRKMKPSGVEWIGEIPEEWEVSRFKYVCEINTEFVDPRTGEYDELPHIGPGSIEKYTGRLTEYKLVKEDGLISGKYHFYPNEIVYGKINPQLGKVAFPQFEGLCSADAYPIHTFEGKMLTKYLLYYMLTKPFIDATILESLRMGMPKINSEDLMKLRILVPPLSEQTRIAYFLDSRCARIDAVIEKTRASVEEYKKLKQSVITEAVTKGIRPGRKMKDSGVEWIGEIPEEWGVRKGIWILKRLERPVNEDDGVITCFRDGEVTLRSNRREEGFTFSLQEAGYQGIDIGDLVVHGMDGFAGAIGISDSRGKGTPVLNVLDSNQYKKYIMYYLRSMAFNGVFLALATGIRVRSCDTNWNKLKELPYPLPPIVEQKEIADYIDYRLAELDVLIDQKNNLLMELDSYKKSIIYEYVTGKREVV